MRDRHRYILIRLVLMGISFFSVATVLFVLFRVMPGDPVSLIVSPQMSAESRRQLLAQYGLNKPMHVQYVLFIKNLFTGNLGVSFRRGAPVTTLLVGATINTIVLVMGALTFAFSFGPALGALFAWRRNSLFDQWGVFTILLFFAAPVFWTGMLALMVFSFTLGWFPAGGMRSATFVSEGMFDTFLSLDFLYHYFLPFAVTGLYWLPLPALYMRNTMIDVLGSDFIELARAQGLPEMQILYRHAARNSLLPVFQYGALAVGFAIGGSVIIETVFSWPGVGRLLWQAVSSQDYPLAQGGFLMIATLIILANFFVDVLAVYIDPRATEERQA